MANVLELKLRRIELLSEEIERNKSRLRELVKERSRLRQELTDMYVQLDETAAQALSRLQNDARRRGMPEALLQVHHAPDYRPESRQAALEDAVRRVAESDTPVDAKQLSTTMGISFHAARLRLARAARAGMLRRVSIGKYEAVVKPAGPSHGTSEDEDEPGDIRF